MKVNEDEHKCVEDECVENDGDMCYERIYKSWVLPLVIVLNLFFLLSILIEFGAFLLAYIVKLKSGAMIHPEGQDTKESEVNLKNEYKDTDIKKTKKMNIIIDFMHCLIRKH